MLKYESRNLATLLSSPITRVMLPTVHFLIFVMIVITLLFVEPSPTKTMGYFSFEQLAPLTFWLLLVALTATSVLTIESHNAIALPAIIATMLAMRLPLFLMFKLPYNPDSYLYMNFIKEWALTGVIDLSVDQRVQFWPVSFLLLFAFRQIGVGELTLWSVGTLSLYSINAALIYLVLKRFLNDKVSKYALLVISIAPTLNFYYYQIMAPQLIGSTLFLLAILVLSAYQKRGEKRKLGLFIAIFALLLFTHHATALLLSLYVFVLLIQGPLASLLAKFRILTEHHTLPVDNRSTLALLGLAMVMGWATYLATVAQQFTRRFWSTIIAVLAGRTSTYNFEETCGSYSIECYAFNLSSFPVYGMRLAPLIVSASVLLALWIRQTPKELRSKSVRREKLGALTVALSFGFLMLISLLLLKGLFLEVPRLFDLVVLFSSVLSASWFISQKGSQLLCIGKASLLLGTMIVASTLGIAVQSSQFVYYEAEKEAILFVSRTYPTASLFTDERLFTFAKFFARNIDVKPIPLELSGMLPDGKITTSVVLISHHSLLYDRYRPVFGHPPLEVLQFVLSHGRIIYSDNGITSYYLAQLP